MTDSHIVKAFDEDLARLDALVTRMGALAAQELEDALQAMRRRDAEQARAVIAADAQVDALESEVEEGAIHIIALRQPMANDLRAVIGALKAAGELERIGDLASNIARRVITLVKEKPPKPLKKELKRMGRLVVAQLVDVMRAYVERDAALARQVWERDEDVDEHYNSLFRELLTYMMEDPRTIGLCTHLLFGARNLERIGDHITNIAEQVYFQATGERLDEKRPKGDVTARLMPETPKGSGADRDAEL